ncbi:hypothetical protein [Sinomonas sp.]|jgi:hypothetical protein|uniref:hypothetical protein n=1 Tax=Sinomonas sp. TaxID=1914986 RepID=UPI003F811CC3
MNLNDIIWAASASTMGLLSLAALVPGQKRLAGTPSSVNPRVEAVGEALAPEAPPAERPLSPADDGERLLLVEAKNAAEEAYARRVAVAEHEFMATKNRSDVHVRAAEMFLEHEERRRSQRVGTAREYLADALLEHRLILAEAEKVVADAKAHDNDVESAAAALEAFGQRQAG